MDTLLVKNAKSGARLVALLLVHLTLACLLWARCEPEQTSSPDSAAISVLVAKPKTWKNVQVELTSSSHELTAGLNPFCVVFSDPDVHDVHADFRLLVGKIRAAPLAASLAGEGSGRFCGTVNLGALYYDPSSYYVVVHFIARDGRKGKATFYVSARPQA